MYAGISKLKNKDILWHMLPSKWVKSHYRKKRTIELLQCLYEAHNDEMCQIVGDHLDGNIDLSLCKLDKSNCSALNYLLEQYRGELKLVSLAFCDIGDEGCRVLLNSMLLRHTKSFPSKFELILHNNKITDKSFSLIASLLPSVTKLQLAFNKVPTSTNVGTSDIFDSLHHNTTLTKLSLPHTSLSLSDMQPLVQMLGTNMTLSVMDISGNDLGPEGCQCLADCRNISLNKLIMGWCKLGVSGADKIGEMLYSNSSITYIDLSSNNIGDGGVGKLVKHLKGNNTIKHLSVWCNNITTHGANHLKLFFLNNTTLNSIELGKNLLKDEGVDLILQSVTITMKYVGLYDTGMTSSCSSVSTAFHCNKIMSISLTLPDNCDSISDSLINNTVLEELKLYGGSDTANYTMINGINTVNSVKKLMFYKGHLSHETISNLIQLRNITALVIQDVDISPNDCLVLADLLLLNKNIKKLTILPFHTKTINQSLVLSFLTRVTHNSTLEELKLRISDLAINDKQFIQYVDMEVKDIVDNRQSYGVPISVKLL